MEALQRLFLFSRYVNINFKKNAKYLNFQKTVEAIALIDNSKSKFLEDKEENFVITAGDKGVLRVWNTKSGECVLTEAEEFKTQLLQFM